MDCQTVKSCDLDGYVAARLLELLNPGKVAVTRDPYNGFRVIANCAPEDLIYPEGWYFNDKNGEDLIYPEGWYFNDKNGLTNKHNSSTGQYDTIGVYDPEGYAWTEAAPTVN